MTLKVGWKNGKFEPSSITLLGKTTEKKEKETGTIGPSSTTPLPRARIQNIQKILLLNSTVAAKRMTSAFRTKVWFPDCLRSKVANLIRPTRQSTTITSVHFPSCPTNLNQLRGLTQTKMSLRQATPSKTSPLELMITQIRWVVLKRMLIQFKNCFKHKQKN